MRRRLIGLTLAMLLLLSVGIAQAKTPQSQADEWSLAIDGLPAQGVAWVGGLSLSLPMEKVPVCPGSGVCTGALWEALWDLEEIASGIADKAKHESAMNAIRNLKGRAAQVDETLGGGGGDLDGDGYPDQLRRYRPGRPVYGNITLKRGFTGDRQLADWYRAAVAGQPEARKSGSLIYLDRSGAEVLRVNLFECWPVAYTLSFDDAGGLVEEIEIAVERLERAALAIAIDEEGIPAAQAPIRLTADGALVGRFESASPVKSELRWGDGVDDDCDGVAAACPAQRPVRCANGSCTAALVAALDDLERQASGIADRTKHDTVKNAIGNIRARVAELDAGVDGAEQPGREVVAPVRVERPLSGAYAAGVWVAAGGQGALSLSYIGQDGKPLATVDLGEAGSLLYSIHQVDGALVETLRFRPARGEVR